MNDFVLMLLLTMNWMELCHRMSPRQSQQLLLRKSKLHLFDLLWICCTICCRIFSCIVGLLRTCCDYPVQHSIWCGFAMDLLYSFMYNKSATSRTSETWAVALSIEAVRRRLWGQPSCDRRWYTQYRRLSSHRISLLFSPRFQRVIFL